MKDPFVSELHKYRLARYKKFNGNFHAMCEELRKFEATLGDRVVKRKPRKTKAAKSHRHTKS